jgi:hypothetical protein
VRIGQRYDYVPERARFSLGRALRSLERRGLVTHVVRLQDTYYALHSRADGPLSGRVQWTPSRPRRYVRLPAP